MLKITLVKMFIHIKENICRKCRKHTLMLVIKKKQQYDKFMQWNLVEWENIRLHIFVKSFYLDVVKNNTCKLPVNKKIKDR